MLVRITAMTFVSWLGFSCSTSARNDNASVPSPATNTVEPVAVSFFDADSAMYFLESQVNFGPRVPGSDAHKACAEWLAERLTAMGATVSDVPVDIAHPVSGKSVSVRNIFARFNPQAKDRVLLLAHYDTRPWADSDPDAANHDTPIDGANDGASGVAVALETARHNALLPKDKGLDILFVDLEDSGDEGNDASWCVGSSYWAANMPYSSADRPRFAILLDMVGGKDAKFMREYFSESYAANVNDMVWRTARELGFGNRFTDRVGGAINDDHIPLLRAGIPTIDIIETHVDGNSGGFNPTWHTLRDNLENIDVSTIDAVGQVVSHIVYRKQ